MGLITSDNGRRKVKDTLKQSDEPLALDEILDRTHLDRDEARNVIATMVDQGELTSTFGRKYKIRE